VAIGHRIRHQIAAATTAARDRDHDEVAQGSGGRIASCAGEGEHGERHEDQYPWYVSSIRPPITPSDDGCSRPPFGGSAKVSNSQGRSAARATISYGLLGSAVPLKVSDAMTSATGAGTSRRQSRNGRQDGHGEGQHLGGRDEMPGGHARGDRRPVPTSQA
jgi:hypothetical protein